MQVVAPKDSKDNKLVDGYNKFINSFKSVSNSLVDTLEATLPAILFGANLIENSIDNKEIIYMHPIECNKENITKFVKYEAGSEEGVSLLLLSAFCEDANGDLGEFIDDLDIGYLSAESSISEEELEEIVAVIDRAGGATIVVADDIYTHEGVENIALALANIANDRALKLYAIEPKFPTNKIEKRIQKSLSEPDYLPSYDGVVVYSIKSDDAKLIGSKQFAMAAKVQDGHKVHFEIDGIDFEREFKLDNNLKGTIAINPTDNLEVLSSYRFKRIKINKVGSENE